MPLSIHFRGQIENFLADHNLGSLYKEYIWNKDTWEKGFPDMRQLETDLTTSVKNGLLTKTLILSVAKWGRLKNSKRIQCPENFPITLFRGNDLSEFFRFTPSTPLKLLRETIKVMGPTYFSKVLMFSQPQLYGAIDTRLTRVFGKGDIDNENIRWLTLETKNSGSGWYIPENQNSWPGEYDTWIEILHYIANLCNSNGYKCPHPEKYVACHLRERGIWIAADIETASFSYASKRLTGEL